MFGLWFSGFYKKIVFKFGLLVQLKSSLFTFLGLAKAVGPYIKVSEEVLKEGRGGAVQSCVKSAVLFLSRKNSL